MFSGVRNNHFLRHRFHKISHPLQTLAIIHRKHRMNRFFHMTITAAVSEFSGSPVAFDIVLCHRIIVRFPIKIPFNPFFQSHARCRSPAFDKLYSCNGVGVVKHTVFWQAEVEEASFYCIDECGFEQFSIVINRFFVLLSCVTTLHIVHAIYSFHTVLFAPSFYDVLLRLCFDIHTAIAAATIIRYTLHPNVLADTFATGGCSITFEKLCFRFGYSEADYLESELFESDLLPPGIKHNLELSCTSPYGRSLYLALSSLQCCSLSV